MFDYILNWVLEVFTQEVLLLLVCLPQDFVSESPNCLLRKPAEHLFAP